MEPVTILAITSASMGIGRSIVHTIKELYELAEAYETAALGIRTVATQCNSFHIAVQRLSKWLTTQSEETKHELDEDFWSALQENLQTATMVIDDLDKRIEGFKKTPTKFWTRTKYLWNGVVISELQSQIGGLMSAVSILIQVIDIPTIGGKRSYSLAQRGRLNHLTKSVRHNEEERARIRARQEQNLLDEPVPDTDLLSRPVAGGGNVHLPVVTNASEMTQLDGSTMQQQPRTEVNSSLQPSFSDLAIPDTAPPSSEILEGTDTISTDRSDKKNRKKKSVDEKTKKSFWRNVRPSKPSSTTSFSSLFSSAKSPPAEDKSDPTSLSEPLSRTISETTNITPQTSHSTVLNPEQNPSHLQETPAPIDTTGDKEYFQLQAAMSGMGMMSSDLSAVEKNPEKLDFPAELPSQPVISTTSNRSHPAENPNSPPPKASDVWPSSTNAPISRAKSTYLDDLVPSSQKFERLRPSQRVKETQERPCSDDPSTTNTRISSLSDSTTQRSTTNRLGSFTSNISTDSTQKWSTCPMPSRSINLTVQFEDESFTNKISPSATRVLGVDDHIVEYAGIPITNLTMLRTVEEGYVAGDEVEFVVMDEYEQRTPMLVLGAGMAYLKRLMQEGEYVYWDSQPVPEKLRTKERLRLYRRFELVRW